MTSISILKTGNAFETNDNTWVYDYSQVLASSFNYPVAGAKSIGVGRCPKMGNSSQLIILVIGVRVSRADELQRSSIGSQFN